MAESTFESLFEPRTIAVIGASRRPGSVGYSLLANLLGSRFQGIIYPVNPLAKGILGLRAYPRVEDIPDEVDLAVVIVPARKVPGVLEDCGKKSVKSAIVISAGFREVGAEGKELEEKVQDIVRRYGIALVGPNCLGVICTDPASSMNATFGTQMPRQGNIAFVSQSGALCVAVLDYAKEANIGFSKFISMGNKAGLTENDLLRYLHHDPKTDVILMYLEDLVDGREFMSIARSITSDSRKPKPILALKSGRTVLGARAASSHTGSLAGSDKVYDAIFDQSGVLRADTLEELFDYVKAFSSQPLPSGDKVAIVTNSGGPGILATDSCIRHGLTIASFSQETLKKLKNILPASASPSNPLDLIAEAQEQQYEAALRALLEDKEVQAAIVILTPTAFTHVEEISRAVVRVSSERRKPVLCCYLGIYDVSRGIDILEEHNIPNYRFPESAARVLSELSRFRQWLERPRTGVKEYAVDSRAARAVLDAARREGRSFLYEYEAYEMLKSYGFPVIPFFLVENERAAIESARRVGFPCVLKVVSPDILHKFDFGGVELDLQNEEEVLAAYDRILDNVRRRKPGARIRGLLVEPMAGRGKEIILGMNREPRFGPLLMFGLGGIYVEALEDVSFRLAPIREWSAVMMIKKTRTCKILEGFRGGPVYDIEAIADCLKRLSQFVMDFGEIKEVDLNPLMVYEKGKGCAVVDARIILD